ncbi:MAG: MBL fold metallo-hydrolase [Deltaproteobacteria bacterium]|nr:MBL fold metallo-hydrolase [Deltaproteobacteria bacterium]
MRFRKAGKVADNLWYLGREEAGTYYLEGRNGAIMINGAMSYILPDVLAQMNQFGLDPGKITKFLILHSHFDHVGIVPYFKRTYPAIEVIASAPAWKIFAMPKAIEIMNSFSRMSAKQVGAEEVLKAYDLEWRDDMTGATVGEGGSIDLGGVTLTFMDTPGHSNCSITAYEPNIKAMFASDAVGIPYKDMIFPSMNTNMIQFLESLEKLKPLTVSYLCADHYGYITGEEAGKFIDLSLVAGHQWKVDLENYYQKYHGDIDAAGKSITEFFYHEMPDYFIAPDILEGVFKQILKFIGKNR